MWGAATHDRATGMHRPLTATALVFQPLDLPPALDTEIVVVAVDLCLLWAKEMNSLIQSACSAVGIEPEQLLVVFSHTHAAGLMGLERVKLPGGDLIPEYLKMLASQISAIVRDARASVRPATIGYGVGRCHMAAHRDFWDETNQQYVCGFNPDGPADDTVLVARVTDSANQLVATVVNYACHPTTLAWENTLISPDYPGAMRETVEQATGAPCVFIQGASGDIGPRDGQQGDARVADRNGRQLGYAALEAIESLPLPGTRFEFTGPVISGATLGTWSHVPLDAEARKQHARWLLRRWTLELDYRPDLPTLEQARSELAHWDAEEQAAHECGDSLKARDCRAMAERMTRVINRLVNLPPGRSFPLPITLWKIGDAVWLAVEGEHYNLLQRSLRVRFPNVPIVVATLANGSRPTYLPTAETYGKGIYQESIALLASGSLEKLIDAVEKQMEGWPA
jgi:hypothetical protein